MIFWTGFKLNSNDSIAGPVQSYDNVFRTDYSPIPLCPTPTITGFSPSVIRAGTNEVLTITGTNFGATRGNGQILLQMQIVLEDILKDVIQ